MKLNRKLSTIGATVVVSAAAVVTGFAGTASATPYTATGSATCNSVGGGIEISPPLMLPAIGFAGPATTRETVNIHLGNCTSTDANVTFSGLNGNTHIEASAVGTLTSHSNNVEGLAGNSTPLVLTVTWYGEGLGGAPLAPTHLTVTGQQAYEGLVNDPGNIGFFLGTTTNSGTYVAPSNPAGFQGFETTSPNDMPAGSYSWPGNAANAPGGSTSATVTPKAGTAPTNTLCISQAVLGAYSYVAVPGEGYLVPGHGGASSGLLGTVSGNLKSDPIGGLTGENAGEFISTFSASNAVCSTQLGSAAGSITLGNVGGATAAKVTTSASPSAEPATIGEPLTVSSEPPSMGSLFTSGALVAGGNCTSNPGNFVTFEDGGSPDTLCVLKDPGAFLVSGGYQKPPVVPGAAVWVYGTSNNDIPPASTSATVALAIAGCNSPLPATPTVTNTSCDLASATGSFAATASSATLFGDATTGFASDTQVEGAASGSVNGYGGTNNPDPDGISFIALVATDGLTI